MRTRIITGRTLADRMHSRLLARFGLWASRCVVLGNDRYELSINMAAIAYRLACERQGVKEGQ